MTCSREVLLFESHDAITNFMVQRWRNISASAIAAKGYVAVALSGGKTTIGLYRQLAGSGHAMSWDKTHIFLVDERFVPPNHEDSN